MFSRLFAILVFSASLLMGLHSADAAEPTSEIAKTYADAFGERGVGVAELESFLGHSIDEMTREESGRLISILHSSDRGNNIHRLLKPKQAKIIRVSETTKEDVSPRSFASPKDAANLASEVSSTYDNLKKSLATINENVTKLPSNFPPNLQMEKIVVNDFVNLVSAFRGIIDGFEKRSPEIVDAAVKHRNAIQKAIEELSKGADADRADGDPDLAQLATAQDFLVQAYERRLAWADQMLQSVQGLVVQAKSKRKLLDRWQSVLELVRPVTEAGAATEINMKELAEAFAVLQQALKDFTQFANKIRESSDMNSKGVPPPAKEVRLPVQNGAGAQRVATRK